MGSAALPATNSTWSTRSILLTVKDSRGGQRRVTINKPFARIGSHPGSELVLPKTPQRAFYLHATDDGIYCLTLASGPEMATASDGWLAPSQVLRVGTYEISATLGNENLPSQPLPDLRAPFPAGHARPELLIEYRDGRQASCNAHLERKLTLIGRSAPSDILINHSAVSRVHCLLYWDGKYLWVVDLLSGNGTRLDVRPIESGKMPPGHRLYLDKVRLTLLAKKGHDSQLRPTTKSATNGTHQAIPIPEAQPAADQATPAAPPQPADSQSAAESADSSGVEFIETQPAATSAAHNTGADAGEFEFLPISEPEDTAEPDGITGDSLSDASLQDWLTPESGAGEGNQPESTSSPASNDALLPPHDDELPALEDLDWPVNSHDSAVEEPAADFNWAALTADLSDSEPTAESPSDEPVATAEPTATSQPQVSAEPFDIASPQEPPSEGTAKQIQELSAHMELVQRQLAETNEARRQVELEAEQALAARDQERQQWQADHASLTAQLQALTAALGERDQRAAETAREQTEKLSQLQAELKARTNEQIRLEESLRQALAQHELDLQRLKSVETAREQQTEKLSQLQAELEARASEQLRLEEQLRQALAQHELDLERLKSVESDALAAKNDRQQLDQELLAARQREQQLLQRIAALEEQCQTLQTSLQEASASRSDAEVVQMPLPPGNDFEEDSTLKLQQRDRQMGQLHINHQVDELRVLLTQTRRDAQEQLEEMQRRYDRLRGRSRQLLKLARDLQHQVTHLQPAPEIPWIEDGPTESLETFDQPEDFETTEAVDFLKQENEAPPRGTVASIQPLEPARRIEGDEDYMQQLVAFQSRRRSNRYLWWYIAAAGAAVAASAGGLWYFLG